jgi:tetrahydromethanopterin S-methyltransferase subunit A
LHYDFAAVEQQPVVVATEEETGEKLHNEDSSHIEKRETIVIENRTMAEEEFEWREVRRGLLDIQGWLTGLAYLSVCMSLYSFSLFL